MQKINTALRKYPTLRDFSSVVRLFGVLGICVYAIIVLLFTDLNGTISWSLLAGGVVLYSYVNSNHPSSVCQVCRI
ncbi:hypothetical protein BDR26DRAFT_858284 [Obelidium mucronatum]|nr:hypothetical protein BDR26DRAFT_858284 [Obelidium mucronatum]